MRAVGNRRQQRPLVGGTPAGVRVEFTVRLVDRLPELFARIAATPADLASADQLTAAARDDAVSLRRDAELDAVPRVGATVVADPNFAPVRVVDVRRHPDGAVRVELADLDADEDGPAALEVLVANGWQPEPQPSL